MACLLCPKIIQQQQQQQIHRASTYTHNENKNAWIRNQCAQWSSDERRSYTQFTMTYSGSSELFFCFSSFAVESAWHRIVNKTGLWPKVLYILAMKMAIKIKKKILFLLRFKYSYGNSAPFGWMPKEAHALTNKSDQLSQPMPITVSTCYCHCTSRVAKKSTKNAKQ